MRTKTNPTVGHRRVVNRRGVHRLMIAAVGIGLLALVLPGSKPIGPYDETREDFRYLSLFSEVLALVENDYVEEIRPEEKFPGAFSGLLTALHPYCAYLDREQTTIHDLYTRGKACESGIHGVKISGYFHITTVEAGSPAGVAGIKPGDTLRAVNGKSIFDRSFWEMYLSLFTAAPASLELIVFKGDSGDPAMVKFSTRPMAPGFRFEVVGTDVPGGPQIVRITLPRIDSESVSALDRELGRRKPDRLILDLRNHRGGDAAAFTRLAGLLTGPPVQLTLKMKDREEPWPLGGPREGHYRSHSRNDRMVVLVDPTTRMYGELLAALLQKTGGDAVTVMGAPTMGYVPKLKKITLSDGSSILLTEGTFRLDGKDLAADGVEPDIKMDINQERDHILERAIEVLKENSKPNGQDQKKQTKQ